MNWFQRLFTRKKEVVPQKSASELLYELRRKRKVLSYSRIDSKDYRKTEDAIKSIESEIATRPDEFLNPLNPMSPLYMGRDDWQGIDNNNQHENYPSNNDTGNKYQSDSTSHDSGSHHSHDSHSHDTGGSYSSEPTSYDSGSSFSSDSSSYDSGNSYTSDY